MGNVKEAMLEHRMVQQPKSRTLGRSTGANDILSRKHWSEEIRNSMYQMTDEEIVSFLIGNPMERERMRIALRMADDEEDNKP